jgi:hypothetical protein
MGLGLYPGWLGAGLIAIRTRPDGAAWMLAVLAIVFAAEIPARTPSAGASAA